MLNAIPYSLHCGLLLGLLLVHLIESYMNVHLEITARPTWSVGYWLNTCSWNLVKRPKRHIARLTGVAQPLQVGGNALGSTRPRFRDPLGTGTKAPPLTGGSVDHSVRRVSRTLATADNVGSVEITRSGTFAWDPPTGLIITIFRLFPLREVQNFSGGGVIDWLADPFVGGFTRGVRVTHCGAVVVADPARGDVVRIGGGSGIGVGTDCFDTC